MYSTQASSQNKKEAANLQMHVRLFAVLTINQLPTNQSQNTLLSVTGEQQRHRVYTCTEEQSAQANIFQLAGYLHHCPSATVSNRLHLVQFCWDNQRVVL